MICTGLGGMREMVRDGVDGVQSVTMPRSVVRIRDVKLATLLGDPRDGIGYIQLSGFSSDAGREMRQAITYLQQREAELTNQLVQTEAELAAAMEGLRDARREAEELRTYVERAKAANG